jgi:GntR family transcriptional regulator
MLKRSPSLTEKAKATIKRRILNNEFEDGRIPSETDLANELGVSRTTIRDALSRLELEGSIYRKQGAGTFVNLAGLQIHTRLEAIWTYETMLREHGYNPANRIIKLEEQPADPQISQDLLLKDQENLLVIHKLFLADEQPVILSINHIPTNIITTPYQADDFHPPIYQFLTNSCQQHLTYYLSEIVPIHAPAWLAETLHLPQGKTALVSFQEIGYNQENQPLIKAVSYFRDDLVRFRLIRRQAG